MARYPTTLAIRPLRARRIVTIVTRSVKRACAKKVSRVQATGSDSITGLSAEGRREHKDLAKNHPYHPPALRSERHPDTNLAGPAGDIVGHRAVKANARDRHRKQSKGAAQAGQRDLLVRLVDPCPLGFDIGQRRPFVRPLNQIAHGIDIAKRISRCSRVIQSRTGPEAPCANGS
jgi:hypothetical protein